MDSEILDWLNAEEKRGEARLNTAAALFIEVESAEPGQVGGGRVIVCEAVDLSANGIQCLISEALQPGAILQMALVLPEFKDSFKLTGEVMWVRNEKNGYATGLRFFDSDGTEIVNWKRAMAKWLS